MHREPLATASDLALAGVTLRILGLVPARGGSKRLPGKNLRPLGGVPLIGWTIRPALASRLLTDVLVSTDDSAIAEVARSEGAMVPWLRPANLATDTSSSVDVALHALDWYEKVHGAVDGLMLLQPTSPFRHVSAIAEAIALFSAAPRRPVVGVSPAATHPDWCYRIEAGRMSPYCGGTAACRSQDLPPAYAVNGTMYLIAPATLRRERRFVIDDAQPLVSRTEVEAIDIDTLWDWRLAEIAIAEQPVQVPR